MKRGNHFESAGPSKRILSDVATATNNQTGSPNIQQNLNGDNRLPTDSRTMPSSTAPSFQYMPYNGNEFYNMDASIASSSNMMNTYPRMWHPNYNYGLSVPNVNSFNNMNGETSVNTDERPNEAAIRSPSPVVAFSKDNVDDVITKLEDNNSFRESIQIFQKWLTNGECNRGNSEEFCTLINKCHKQVWRIMMEKTSVKDNMNKEKKEVNEGMKDIASLHAEQLKIVEYCKKQKVWDQFSKGQRKQLLGTFDDVVKSKPLLGAVLSDIEEDDVADPPDSTTDCDEAELAEYQKLFDENDNVNHEIEALQEDTKSVEIEDLDGRDKNKAVCAEHQAIHDQLKKEADELEDYKKRTSSANASEPQIVPEVVPPVQHSNLDDVSLDEYRLLSTLSIFLTVHPTGASLDYMSSYAMTTLNTACETRRLEHLLQMFPGIFVEKSIGIGCNLRKVWLCSIFTYFKNLA